jgi:hypothetical protein
MNDSFDLTGDTISSALSLADTPVVVGFDRKLDLVTPLMVHTSFGSLVTEVFIEQPVQWL